MQVQAIMCLQASVSKNTAGEVGPLNTMPNCQLCSIFTALVLLQRFLYLQKSNSFSAETSDFYCAGGLVLYF